MKKKNQHLKKKYNKSDLIRDNKYSLHIIDVTMVEKI